MLNCEGNSAASRDIIPTPVVCQPSDEVTFRKKRGRGARATLRQNQPPLTAGTIVICEPSATGLASPPV